MVDRTEGVQPGGPYDSHKTAKTPKKFDDDNDHYKSQYHWNKASVNWVRHLFKGNISDADCNRFLDQLAKSVGDSIQRDQKVHEEAREFRKEEFGEGDDSP